MRELPDDRQIYVSSRLWHEIHPKVNLTPFIFGLHEGIDLAKYGDGLNKFYFTFLILLPDNELFPPGTYFDEEKQEAEIAVAIDYDDAFNASEEELIKMMEEAYLKGIELIDTLPLKSEFDTQSFKEDVEAIFSQDKWYELITETV